MFKFLKEKLKNWTEKLSKSAVSEEKSAKKKPGEKEKKTRKKIIASPETEEEQEKNFFQKIGEKISKIRISDKEFELYGEELKMLLLENNVAFPVAEKIISELKGKIVNQEFLKKEVEEQIKDSLKDIIEDILIEPFDLVEKIKKKNEKEKNPYVILFCGINGSGKTTTVAKVAENLKSRGVSVILAAADTFRAASIEQLKMHGDKIGVNVISN